MQAGESVRINNSSNFRTGYQKGGVSIPGASRGNSGLSALFEGSAKAFVVQNDCVVRHP
jgi:hypothetical protein